MQALEGPVEDVDVEALRLRVPRVARAVGLLERLGRHRAAVDGAGVAVHPLGEGVEARHRAVVEVAARRGADVHDEVAAAGDVADQHLDALLLALPRRLVAVVAPRAGEGLAALPRRDGAVRAARGVLGLELLGRDDVRRLRQVQAVVEDDVGLQLANELHELLALPVGAALAARAVVLVLRVGEVEPEDVDLPVLREQLRHLVAHVLGVLADVALLVHLRDFRGGAVAQRMLRVDRELRMVPVEERVVEADAQALGAEGVDDLAQQVALRGRVRRLVVGELAVPEAEALVVLRGDDEILHAGALGGAGPFLRVEQVRVEVLEVLAVVLGRDLFVVLDPLVAGGHRVEAPVDEHPEAGFGEPVGAGGFLFHGLDGLDG